MVSTFKRKVIKTIFAAVIYTNPKADHNKRATQDNHGAVPAL